MTQLGRCTKATHDVFSSIILQSWIQVNFWFQSWFPDDLLNIFWMRCIEKSNRTIESTGNIYIYTSIIQYYIYIILMMMIIIIIICVCVSFCVPLNKSKEILSQDISFRWGPHPNGHWHYGCSGRLSSRGRLRMSSSSTLQLVRLGGKILGIL